MADSSHVIETIGVEDYSVYTFIQGSAVTSVGTDRRAVRSCQNLLADISARCPYLQILLTQIGFLVMLLVMFR